MDTNGRFSVCHERKEFAPRGTNYFVHQIVSLADVPIPLKYKGTIEIYVTQNTSELVVSIHLFYRT